MGGLGLPVCTHQTTCQDHRYTKNMKPKGPPQVSPTQWVQTGPSRLQTIFRVTRTARVVVVPGRALRQKTYLQTQWVIVHKMRAAKQQTRSQGGVMEAAKSTCCCLLSFVESMVDPGLNFQSSGKNTTFALRSLAGGVVY